MAQTRPVITQTETCKKGQILAKVLSPRIGGEISNKVFSKLANISSPHIVAPLYSTYIKHSHRSTAALYKCLAHRLRYTTKSESLIV